MGNCLFGGLGDPDGVIKVVTSNGGVMEFFEPITVGNIADEFPGHGIFRNQDLFWKPLSHQEELVAGHSYYLLPLSGGGGGSGSGDINTSIVREGHVRSNSIPASSVVAPYRMSFDYQGMVKRPYTEVFSTRGPYYNQGGGFWKVKLVIAPELLLEILSQEGRTQELIESVRTVAKCGGGGGGGAVTAVGLSDQWSLSSSSRNASSKVDGLLKDIN
ncbi:hypothetical protein PanWU01x14_056890 [Parasponia andersonii]|uniref:Uncharacterized protein n=1 Tax=Parasponia andersonii TaxID=3476 RepID=A0A2P5DJP0_PARAD|nr:hypothetical protein PanWU01x14_056890 [Parasponia andersonii]